MCDQEVECCSLYRVVQKASHTRALSCDNFRKLMYTDCNHMIVHCNCYNKQCVTHKSNITPANSHRTIPSSANKTSTTAGSFPVIAGWLSISHSKGIGSWVGLDNQTNRPSRYANHWQKEGMSLASSYLGTCGSRANFGICQLGWGPMAWSFPHPICPPPPACAAHANQRQSRMSTRSLFHGLYDFILSKQ